MNKLHVATFAILTVALTLTFNGNAMENNDNAQTAMNYLRLVARTTRLNTRLNSHQEPTTSNNNGGNLVNPAPQSTSYAAHQELGTVLGNFDKPLRRQLFPKFE